MADFKPNSKVLVRSLKQYGTVLERVKNGYLVVCGSLKITCDPSDLEAIPPDKWKKYSRNFKKTDLPKTGSGTFAKEIDLHGMRVEEALAAVQRFLDKALVADADKVEIVHGVGTGRLLQAIHAYLKTLPTVKKFELDSNNTGVTKVYF